MTLGPGGRNVVIDPFEAANYNALAVYPKPVITKDGVTVAQHLNLLNDSLENIGARLMIDAAERANDTCKGHAVKAMPMQYNFSGNEEQTAKK